MPKTTYTSKLVFNQTTNDVLVSFCLVQLVLDGIGRGGLGEDMYSARLKSKDLPPAVELTTKDSPLMTSVKEMVLQMTLYDPKDRPSSNNVLRTVQSIYRKVGEFLLW